MMGDSGDQYSHLMLTHPVRSALLSLSKVQESKSPEKESNLPEVTQLGPLHTPLTGISLLLPPTNSYLLFRHFHVTFSSKSESNLLVRLSTAVQFSSWPAFSLCGPITCIIKEILSACLSPAREAPLRQRLWLFSNVSPAAGIQ